MDFIQGSSPANFISFCLEISPPEDETLPAVTPQLQSSTTGNTAPAIPAQDSAFYSPQNVTSKVDVNTYADAMVQRMEPKQGTSQENQARDKKEGELLSTEALEEQTDQSVPNPQGRKHPILHYEAKVGKT